MRLIGSSALLALLLVLFGLFAAACGGGGTTAGVARLTNSARPTSSSSTVYRTPPTKADMYAAASCMRRRGVPNFPNPIFVLGRYHFGFTAGSGVNPDTPQFKTAEEYCTAHFLGTGRPFSPTQLAQWHTQALNYARCIRAHGLKVFPDPPPANQNRLGQPEILLPSSLPQNLLGTPAWVHARQACKSLSAGIAVAWSS
jgi:hypothetical protein